jgi:hypothetical protein
MGELTADGIRDFRTTYGQTTSPSSFPFFNLPEPSIAHRSTIDPEVVARFRFRSRNSATLGLTTENGGRNPKN